jgi:hypothetical protein
MPIFINPLTDFGFKRIFANPKHTNKYICYKNSAFHKSWILKQVQNDSHPEFISGSCKIL